MLHFRWCLVWVYLAKNSVSFHQNIVYLDYELHYCDNNRKVRDILMVFPMLPHRILKSNPFRYLIWYLKTIFRYIAICHPFVVRQDAFELSIRSNASKSSSMRSRREFVDLEPSRKRFYQYSSTVVLISFLSNIPVFWEFTSCFDNQNAKMKIRVSSLRINENYIIFFKNGFEGVVMMILPFVAMICINARIIYTLTQRQKSVIRTRSIHRITNTEKNLGKVLIAMDIVFLLCNLGRFIVNIWEIFHIEELKQCLKINQSYKVLDKIMIYNKTY